MSTTTTTQVSQWPGMTQYYSDKAVFITGATGFMGKCLLEKILRSLPNVTQVMILVRPKRGKSMQERIDSLLKSKVSKKAK